MKKKILISGIIIVSAAVVVAAVIFLINYINGGNAKINPSNKPDETTAAVMTTDENGSTAAHSDENGSITAPSDEPEVDDPTDLLDYAAVNDEIYSWITIENTQINYPVAQAKMDDNFYIDHDVNKDYSFAGTIYSQLCNQRDYSDRVTVLYGHNMLNGSMFADLHKFRDQAFFESNPEFFIYTKNRRLTYKVVAAFDYDDRHIMNAFDFRDDNVYQSWLNDLQNPHTLYANVRKDIKLGLDSKMVVLSTCQNSGDGRYLVFGVLTDSKKTH